MQRIASWYRDFLSDLAALLAEGLPLIEALLALEGRKGKHYRAEIAALRGEIVDGGTLADAMRGRGAVFPVDHAAMVEAGERSGQLEEVLRSLALELETEREAQQTARSRLLRSSLTVAAMLVLLPLPTAFEHGLIRYILWEVVLWSPIGVMAWLVVQQQRFFPRGSRRHRILEAVLLRLPFVGKSLADTGWARCFVLFSQLVESGLSLSESFQFTAKAARWERQRAEIDWAATRFDNQLPLAQAFSVLELFRREPNELDRIAAGEKAGALDRALRELGLRLRRRSARRWDRFLIILPVVATILVGLFVCVYAYKTISGLYTLP